MYIIVKSNINNINYLVSNIFNNMVCVFGLDCSIEKTYLTCIYGKKYFNSNQYTFPYLLKYANEEIEKIMYIGSSINNFLKYGEIFSVKLISNVSTLILVERQKNKKQLVIDYYKYNFIVLNKSNKRLLKLIDMQYCINTINN